MLYGQFVATVLLYSSICHSNCCATPIAAIALTHEATITTTAATSSAIRDTHAGYFSDNIPATIPAAAALSAMRSGEAIGATSLAAAAGAAAAMVNAEIDDVYTTTASASITVAGTAAISIHDGGGDGVGNNDLHRDSGSSFGINVGGGVVGNSKVDTTNRKLNNSVVGDASGVAAAPTQAVHIPNHGNDELLSSSANLLLEPTSSIVNLTRQHDGDIFRTTGLHTCNSDTCVGLSSGTAGVDLLSSAGDKTANTAGAHSTHIDADLLVLGKRSKFIKSNVAHDSSESCQCRCLPYLNTYREDLGICVDDIHECTLSPFVSGSSSEKIPFVFLPLRGQIIYPSREISFPNIRTPVCAVTGAQFLTINGWSDLRNPIDTDYPFRMFRDEGRTFLQWLGEPDLRHKMQGRLIVVHLVCRDMTFTLNVTHRDHLMPPKNVFSPCVAFRVNGSPVKYTPNVSEVLFQSEATSTLASTSDGMSTKEYVVIGICSLLLGLIYVASVFLYLHMKKRKRRNQSPHMRNSLDDITNEINYPKNDQVTFGAPFNRSGSIYSATSMGTTNEPRSRASIGSLKEEMGIIKSNPLLQHFPQLGEHNSGFASDISNSNSECEMDGNFHEKLKQMQTSVLVHPQVGMNNNKTHNSPNDSPKSASGQSNAEQLNEPSSSSSPTQETECLPVENVSIVEDMMTEEKLEHLRQMVNGNIRKKLYFNPAYFEPHLLAQPPPAALEFLHKIREVIAIAKYKMATKRYQPSLIMIPEESTMRSETPSMYSSNRQQSPSECQGCANNRCSGHVKNCGDKRNSIEKWLQTVSSNDEVGNNDRKNSAAGTSEQQQINKQQQQRHQGKQQTNTNENARCQSVRSSSPPHNNRSHSHNNKERNPPRKDVTPPKQRPPPPPTPVVSGNNSRIVATSKSQSHDSASNVIDVIPSAASVSYQLYCTSISTGPSVTIPVNRNYNKLATALSAAANLYGFAATGNDIYNNPKFTLDDSPPLSPRNCNSQRGKSSSTRKRCEPIDQYDQHSACNIYGSAKHQQYDILRNMNKLPESMYDALNREYNGTNGFHLDIPTPDYDSTIEKKVKDIYNTQSSGPSVPTPDYSTLSRKSLKQVQPDSPIYRRKSPQYLIVDYETDSLERLEATKRKSSHSSSSPSSDVSSQLSPSLSTALPLEEELEISHTVYDKSNGFRPEMQLKKKVLNKSDNDDSKQKEIAARIKYDTPYLGSMTIEVEHEPQSDIERSTDSDQFEPDTLDRKPKKQSFCDVNAWTGQVPKKATNGEQSSNRTSQSAIDGCRTRNGSYAQLNINQPKFMLRTTNSFRSQSSHDSNCSEQAYESNAEQRKSENVLDEEVTPSFNTLRDIYQSPLIRQNSESSCKCGGQYASTKEFNLDSEQGRLLTLEAKQKRRQQIVESPVPPPPVSVDILNSIPNKTTIKISTPKVRHSAEAAVITPQVHNGRQSPSPPLPSKTHAISPKKVYELTKNVKSPPTPTSTLNQTHSSPTPNSTLNSTINSKISASYVGQKKCASRSPPPPPPPSSASTTLTSQRSLASTQHSQHSHHHHHHHHYQNQNHHNFIHHFTTSTNATTTATEEDETASNHSESTEFTGVSDNFAHSELGGSYNNTLSSTVHETQKDKLDPVITQDHTNSLRSDISNTDAANVDKGCESITSTKQTDSPTSKTKSQHIESDYGAMFNTHINGLRNDYSLTKYMNRRKSHDESVEEEQNNSCNDIGAQLEANNNINNTKNVDVDSSKLDLLSIGSRSNRSSSRLSDRTKEMYRNSGVPVGIAYPQRSTASNNNSANSTPPPAPTPTPTPTNTVQTVYHCEIEPVQLTHGMQIAMGLKDRAKKAKDLKNAWKKFVSMAASKFSPTHSPSPSYDKKPPNFLEVLDRDEGISSIINDHPHVSTPKMSYSAPASQNYYEQRFGPRPLEMDSGYMSADSSEAYKRSFYDRYNFKKMSGRDRVIRVDTIEDNSDGGSTLTDRHNGVAASARRSSILDSNRFEDFEHMGEPPENEVAAMRRGDTSHEALEVEISDAESDKTLTQSSGDRGSARNVDASNEYSSEEEEQQRRGDSPSYGSSETDGETNAEDMWESGAESIETHSVLYKNVRKS